MACVDPSVAIRTFIDGSPWWAAPDSFEASARFIARRHELAIPNWGFITNPSVTWESGAVQRDALTALPRMYRECHAETGSPPGGVQVLDSALGAGVTADPIIIRNPL
jgi:hypothetical protein